MEAVQCPKECYMNKETRHCAYDNSIVGDVKTKGESPCELFGDDA